MVLDLRRIDLPDDLANIRKLNHPDRLGWREETVASAWVNHGLRRFNKTRGELRRDIEYIFGA